jgi:multiple sugar transport system substrate-binding protein
VWFRKSLIVGLAFALSLTFAGCGSGTGAESGDGGKQAQDSLDTIDKPVTLKIYAPMGDETFAKFFEEPIKAKFPNVTLERLIPTVGNAPGAQELVSQGNTPDLVYAVPGWFGKEKLMGLYTDLSPLIKKYNFDMNRFDPQVLATIKTYSEQGKIEFLPESMTTAILMYNKDIFDHFGVAYPKDGMTWEQTIELAAKVSRSEGDKNYFGFGMDKFFLVNNTQLSLGFVDPKTNKASVNNEGWQNYFNTMKQFFEIQGNKPMANKYGNYNLFSKDKTVAMFAGRLEQINTMILAEEGGLNWDIVTLPTFSDLPNTGTQVNAPYLAITPVSEHKDEAFKVMAYLLNDDIQLSHNKDGRLTVLKDEKIRNQFGANIKELAGKHIQAVTALKPAKPRPFTLYDDYVVTNLANGFTDVVTGKKDVNTALRDSEEAANKVIEENK